MTMTDQERRDRAPGLARLFGAAASRWRIEILLNLEADTLQPWQGEWYDFEVLIRAGAIEKVFADGRNHYRLTETGRRLIAACKILM